MTAALLADALQRFHANTPVWAPEDRKLLIQAAALLRTQAAALAEREWQPIETAPKDDLLVLLTNGATVSAGGWYDECVIEGEPCPGDWWDIGGGMQPAPTHWQPLPAPPLAAAPSPNKE